MFEAKLSAKVLHVVSLTTRGNPAKQLVLALDDKFLLGRAGADDAIRGAR
jgi:hypothetical protein